jgi:hypothetical protein
VALLVGDLDTGYLLYGQVQLLLPVPAVNPHWFLSSITRIRAGYSTME